MNNVLDRFYHNRQSKSFDLNNLLKGPGGGAIPDFGSALRPEKDINMTGLSEIRMKAIILAAGLGTRINRNRETIPKPLYEVKGRSLIEHVIFNFKKAGITEFVIVVGYMAEKIMRKLGDGSGHGVRIKYVMNYEYHKPLGSSVLCAEPYVDKEFLLAMSDHLMQYEGIKKIVTHRLENGTCALLVDKKIDTIFWLADAAKVKLDGNKIVSVDKNNTKFEAVDCGAFKCSPVIFEEIKKAGDHPDTISAAISSFAKNGKMIAVDIGEHRWVDIDEYEELEAARKIFKDIS